MTVDTPQQIIRYVGPDGRLTLEGLQLLLRIVEMLRDHEARIVALEP